MSEKRVLGLTSAFEPSKPAAPPPSGVSSLASRFDTPASTSDEPKVSEKLSGIANRFGTTVADIPAKGAKSRFVPKSAPLPKTKLVEPIVTESPDFSAISRRFASGRANEADAGKADVDPGQFTSAKDTFTKIEAENQPRAQGLVSQYKRDIENGKHAVKEVVKTSVLPEKTTDQEKLVVAEEMAGVINIKSKFEGGATQVDKESVKEETTTNRFEKAATLFEPEVEAPKEDASVAPESKFAAASRMFSGAE